MISQNTIIDLGFQYFFFFSEFKILLHVNALSIFEYEV